MFEFIAKFIRQFHALSLLPLSLFSFIIFLLFWRVIFAKESQEGGQIFVKFMSFINDQNIKTELQTAWPGPTLRMSNVPIASRIR